MIFIKRLKNIYQLNNHYFNYGTIINRMDRNDLEPNNRL